MKKKDLIWFIDLIDNLPEDIASKECREEGKQWAQKIPLKGRFLKKINVKYICKKIDNKIAPQYELVLVDRSPKFYLDKTEGTTWQTIADCLSELEQRRELLIWRTQGVSLDFENMGLEGDLARVPVVKLRMDPGFSVTQSEFNLWIRALPAPFIEVLQKNCAIFKKDLDFFRVLYWGFDVASEEKALHIHVSNAREYFKKEIATGFLDLPDWMDELFELSDKLDEYGFRNLILKIVAGEVVSAEIELRFAGFSGESEQFIKSFNAIALAGKFVSKSELAASSEIELNALGTRVRHSQYGRYGFNGFRFKIEAQGGRQWKFLFSDNNFYPYLAK